MTPDTFWQTVFIRVIETRFFNETFQAANPGIVEKMYNWRKDMKKALVYCRDHEEAAYEFFSYEFCHLRSDEQRQLSGKTSSEWLDAERETRN